MGTPLYKQVSFVLFIKPLSQHYLTYFFSFSFTRPNALSAICTWIAAAIPTSNSYYSLDFFLFNGLDILFLNALYSKYTKIYQNNYTKHNFEGWKNMARQNNWLKYAGVQIQRAVYGFFQDTAAWLCREVMDSTP